MPFEANRTLTAALRRPVPLVLRDFEVMIPQLAGLASELTRTAETLGRIKLAAERHEHEETCEACTFIRNMQKRLSHDLSLLAVQGEFLGRLHGKLSKPDVINHATAEDLLTTCLIARATLDNLIRSSSLFMRGDIRIYNKYVAESLLSIQKLV